MGEIATGDRTAFVFAGGGSLGAVQVGMLKALVASGIRPDLVVGSSVGAINAAYYAGRPGPEGITRLEQVWRELRRETVFPISIVRSLWGVLGRRDHLIDPGSLAALLEREMSYALLEGARLPCYVMASDLRDGAEVVLASGSVAASLRASTALPAVFPPVSLGGRTLIDGSVTSNVPVSIAIRLGASRVVILPTGSPCALKEPPRGPIAIALHALNLLIARQLSQELEHRAGDAHLIVVPPLCPLTTSSYDFSQAGLLIERAEQSTTEWIAAGGLDRTDIPESLQPHTHSDWDLPSSRGRDPSGAVSQLRSDVGKPRDPTRKRMPGAAAR